jgi:hypothetical protein
MTAAAYTCPCPLCRPDNPAPTYTRAWALECEAREVLAMPLNDRKQYLVEVAARRGAIEVDALRAEVARQWEANRWGPA